MIVMPIQPIPWFALLMLLLSATSLPAQSPNVLLIMSDDQGYGDLGYHGNPQLETPTLDRLFAEGTVFERFYVSPVCAPTRASLLTGRYHHRTGTCGVFQGEEILRGEEVTLPEALAGAGYVSGCFGKWHNGNHWPETPNAQGFDEFLGFTAGVIYDYDDPVLEHNGDDVATEGYITDILTDAAIEFMYKANQKGEPFFCYVPYNVPHTPIQVGDELFEKYQAKGLNDFDAGVYAMLENMDANIARLLAGLEFMGAADNTIVIFLSDNGPNSGRYNAGLRAKKGSVYDGGVRVPFVIRWPEKLQQPRRIKTPAAHIDLLPTLAQLCGAKLDPAIKLDGVDLSPLLFDEPFIYNERLIYTFPFSIDVKPGENLPRSLRNDRWCAVRTWRSDWELYDMLADPNQENDLAAKHPVILRQMVTAYERKFAEVTSNGLGAQPIKIGYPEEPVVTLKAGNAFLDEVDGGGIAFSYRKFPLPGNWITNWSDPQAGAHWQIDNQRVGRYLATLHYALANEGKGTEVILKSPNRQTRATIDQPFSSPNLAINFRLENEAEKYRVREWAAVDLGELELPAGEFNLTLAQGESFTSDALEVKGLTLTPVD